MNDLDFSRCRQIPIYHNGEVVLSGVKEHVKDGVRALIKNPFFFITDEMGMMKSAQVIIAAQFLFEQGKIDRVIVIAPAAVRTVWFDQELGELSRHLWHGMPVLVTEFHTKIRQWNTEEYTSSPADRRFRWIVTNYDFIRNKTRLIQLLAFCGPKTLLVLDESNAVANHRTQQTKACLNLRRSCGRVVLLTGTPIGNQVEDLYSQANILSQRIFECDSFYQFRAKHTITKQLRGAGGRPLVSPKGNPVVVVEDWRDVEDVHRRFAPYVLRRLKKDHLKDLPEKMPPVVLGATLTEQTWKKYKSMSEELVVWLSEQTVSVAPQIVTRVMRLSQITSGFIGGVQSMFLGDDDEIDEDAIKKEQNSVEEIGREKLDVFLSWLADRLAENPNEKILVRSRHRFEILRCVEELQALGRVEVGAIIGGQKRAEREHALRLLHPQTMPTGPAVVIMSVGAGSLGLNLTGSRMLFSLSNGYSLRHRLQGDDRLHRPGQLHSVWYGDLIAVGPRGQRTIDHVIMQALMKKENLAERTVGAWVETLKLALASD